MNRNIMRTIQLLLTLIFLVAAGTLPSEIGIVMTDDNGNSYDIDALLKEGKHIVVHQSNSY